MMMTLTPTTSPTFPGLADRFAQYGRSCFDFDAWAKRGVGDVLVGGNSNIFYFHPYLGR